MLSFRKPKENPYATAFQLFMTVVQEMKFHKRSTDYLTREEVQALCRYYSSWMTGKSEYYGHYFARRIQDVVALAVDKPGGSPLSILDCGCGFGTESIAFGLLGANVLGIDLDIYRLGVASERLNYYRNKYHMNLAVSFMNINLFDFEYDNSFDVLYAKESISHIYSVSRFIEFASTILKDNGHLVITEPNSLNPFMAYKAWRAHRSKLYTIKIDERTGQSVPYAVERLVSPVVLNRYLHQNNFDPKFKFYGIPLLPKVLSRCIRLFETELSLPVWPLYSVISMKVS